MNAAGPWVSQIFESELQTRAPKHVRLVKGSHLVVKRIHTEPNAYILQNTDGRIVFVLPFEGDYSLIGTTDVEFEGDAGQAEISESEIDYLLAVVNQHFRSQLDRQAILHSFSGVRPLIQDAKTQAQSISRDYELVLETESGSAPLLSVFGGKLTTYRKLAEAALTKLSPYFPKMGRCWTEFLYLPGGDFSSKAALTSQFSQDYAFLPPDLIDRYVSCYGTLAHRFLSGKSTLAELGQDFGHGLFEAEVRYLMEQEWAESVEDILWRRTKLGLKFSEPEAASLETYLNRTSGKVMAEVTAKEEGDALREEADVAAGKGWEATGNRAESTTAEEPAADPQA